MSAARVPLRRGLAARRGAASRGRGASPRGRRQRTVVTTRAAVGAGFESLGAELGRTVEVKQRAYGDAFGKAGQVLALLYPNGIPRAKLDDALAVVRVVDKLFRVATDRDALGESPWRDIAGYALLATERAERQRRRRGGSR